VNRENLDTAYRKAAEPHMVPDKRDMSQLPDREVDHFLGLKRTHPALHAAALIERERRADAYSEKFKAWTDDDIGTVARHIYGTGSASQSLLHMDSLDKHTNALWAKADLPRKPNGDADHNNIVRHAIEKEADKRGWTHAQGVGQLYSRKPGAPPWPPPSTAAPGAPKGQREQHLDAIRENNRRILEIADHPSTKPWHARQIREHVIDEASLGNLYRTSMDLADMRAEQDKALEGR
jgi:hypothetical protein